MDSEHNSPRWLSLTERASWMRLLAVLQLLPAALDSQLRRTSGLTMTEYYVLAMLSETPTGRIQTKQLATYTNSTLSRISRVLTSLEKQRLVVRIPNPEDARATDIELTEVGRERLVAAAPGHVEFVRRVVFDPQGPRGVEELRNVCEAILTVLDPDARMHRDPLESS